MILLQCLEPSYISDPHHHTSRMSSGSYPPYIFPSRLYHLNISQPSTPSCPCSQPLLHNNHVVIIIHLGCLMMSASMLQALQCNTSPRVHPPNYAPTLLRHRPLVSPPSTAAALDIGPMPLSHHVLQYRCVLLDQSRFRGMLQFPLYLRSE